MEAIEVLNMKFRALKVSLTFLSRLGSPNFREVLNFLFVFMPPFSKPLCNNLNNASTSNIQEVVEFVN